MAFSVLLIAVGAAFVMIAGAIHQASVAWAESAKTSYEAGAKQDVNSRVVRLTDAQIDKIIKDALRDDERGMHSDGGATHSYITKDDPDGYSYRVEFKTAPDSTFRTTQVSYLPSLCGRPVGYEITLIRRHPDYSSVWSEPVNKGNFKLNCPVVPTQEERQRADPSTLENREKVAISYLGSWDFSIECNGKHYTVETTFKEEDRNAFSLVGHIKYRELPSAEARQGTNLRVEGDRIEILGIGQIDNEREFYPTVKLAAPRQDNVSNKIENGTVHLSGGDATPCGSWSGSKRQ